MNNSKNILPIVLRVCKQAKRLASTEVPSSRFASMKEQQVKFGIQDGTPVHYKKGRFDKILAQGTIALGFGGAFWGLQTFYSLTFGKN